MFGYRHDVEENEDLLYFISQHDEMDNIILQDMLIDKVNKY